MNLNIPLTTFEKAMRYKERKPVKRIHNDNDFERKYEQTS